MNDAWGTEKIRLGHTRFVFTVGAGLFAVLVAAGNKWIPAQKG